MLHIENGKVFVELEINKKEFDLAPLTTNQITLLMRANHHYMISALQSRMEKCEKQLILASTNKTPMVQNESGMFWNHGKFSFSAYRAMEEGIDRLNSEEYMEVLHKKEIVVQIIQALMDDEQGLDSHELIGLLVEFAITPPVI